ncbi:LysE family translocator [Chachezhania antarctica]|uniref:LysE family translocator n=1 Tax=Chachezhania antarctica TaxID=2340860 RepID=UPI000EB17739|nr:LysE family transporter [Chachezhania antarctica]|tara:strand:+ start:178 stop:828 length:651 start_codon:yes stop_codon:yes gene_type:complete
MLDWTGLTAIVAAFFIVAVSPGPATLAVSTASAASGRRSAMLFGCGLGAGLGFWGLVAATGLGAILQMTTPLLVALKVFGGLYLLWLAFGSARSAMRKSEAHNSASDNAPVSEGQWFLRGLVLNLSNPKAVVAWMAALSVGLGAESDWMGVAIATGCCVVIGFAIYAGYAAAFSIAAVMRGYAGLRRWVDGAVALLFSVAWLALIRSAFARGQSVN